MHEYLESLSKEELAKLVEAYAKSIVAMDGVWFQAIEREQGMDSAMHFDEVAWKGYAVSDTKRLMRFLGLGEQSGLDGLEECLRVRSSTFANGDVRIERTEDALIYTIGDCRVQRARERKGMEFHPCKCVGQCEYEGLARTVDDRITCECLSCFPEVTDDTVCCAWRFTILEE